MPGNFVEELKQRHTESIKRSRGRSEEEGGIVMETFMKPSHFSNRKAIEKDIEETNSIDYFEVGETSMNNNNQNKNITKIVQRDTVYIYKNGYYYLCMAGLAVFMTGLFALNDYILISYTNINCI